jgi:methylated-DNA-[protein]-cysteine S-methyltransferase
MQTILKRPRTTVGRARRRAAARVISASRATARQASDVEPISVIAFHTKLNWMAFACEDERLHGIVFGYATESQARKAVGAKLPPWIREQTADEVESRWVVELIELLQRFAEGEPVDFANVPLALEHLTLFGARVVEACRGIGWGRVRSYGELAAECGSPGAARAVGSVMAKNRFPLIVPCHRVLGSGGSLGGYSAPDGLKMKRRLLASEQS